MKKRIIFAVLSVLLLTGVAYAVTTIGTISSTVTYVDPPLQVTGAVENGVVCSVSGSSISCTSSFVIGAANALQVTVKNPASTAQSAFTTTTAPSACAMTITDAPTTSIPAGSSSTLTVSILVASSATSGTACTFQTQVSQA